MNMKKRKIQSYKSYKDKQNNGISHIFRVLPILFIITILPLIMRYHVYDTGLSKFAWFSDNGENYDFFLYYKQLFFIIISGVMLVAISLLIYKNKGKVRLPFIFIPLGTYAILSLLSTIFSKNSIYGWTGMLDQFESVFVLLGYCITVVYIFLFLREEDVHKLFRGLLVGLLVMNIIGISQRIGKDIVISDFGKSLLFPSEMSASIENLNMSFAKHTVYLTLFNPNYVGVYVALLLPIITILFFLRKKVNGIKGNVLYVFNIIGLILCLIGSGSESAIIGLVVSTFFLIILLWKYIFKNKYLTTIFVIIIIGLSAGFIYKIDTIRNLLIPSKIEVALNDIITDKKVEVLYKGNKLLVDYIEDDSGSIVFNLMDENGTMIDYAYNEETKDFIIEDERFNELRVSPVIYDGQLCMRIKTGAKEWIFTKGEDDTFYYYNRFMRLDKIKKADSTLFTGYERFASGRGYIWSRTIPLLKEYLFLGSGADTYAIAFPQQDYVALYNYGYANSILTKPHSLYLQIAVQTGVLSLIAFITFYLVYFIDSIGIYFGKKYNNSLEQYGVAVFIGTISYMVVGISNDSSITVAPIFWVMIGLGTCINYKIKKRVDVKEKL